MARLTAWVKPTREPTTRARSLREPIERRDFLPGSPPDVRVVGWGVGCVVQELGAGVDGSGVRDGDSEFVRELDECAGHAVELERLAGFEVLEHRGLVVADREARLEPPFQ